MFIIKFKDGTQARVHHVDCIDSDLGSIYYDFGYKWKIINQVYIDKIVRYFPN